MNSKDSLTSIRGTKRSRALCLTLIGVTSNRAEYQRWQPAGKRWGSHNER